MTARRGPWAPRMTARRELRHEHDCKVGLQPSGHENDHKERASEHENDCKVGLQGMRVTAMKGLGNENGRKEGPKHEDDHCQLCSLILTLESRVSSSAQMNRLDLHSRTSASSGHVK